MRVYDGRSDRTANPYPGMDGNTTPGGGATSNRPGDPVEEVKMTTTAQHTVTPWREARPAHMAASMADYDHVHHCVKCGAPVRIMVRQPASVVLVLQHWHDKLNGRCKTCLNKADRKAVGK